MVTIAGYRLKGRDVYYAGVASHYIPCEKVASPYSLSCSLFTSKF